jgi:SAM-dependent methyltransferase
MTESQFISDLVPSDAEPNSYDMDWAQEYAARYALRNPTDLLADFILARLASGNEVLELCVGNGRIAIPIARQGKRVIGVDNAPAMLELLRRDSQGLPVEAILGDCATVDLGRKFSLVVLLFNSLFLMRDFEHQKELFANISRHLNPGGRLIIETFVPRPYESRAAGGLRPVVVDGSRMELIARSWDVAERILWIQRLIVETSGSIRLRPTRFRYLLPAEQDKLAADVGLSLEAQYADFSETPFEAESRGRVVVYRREGAG